MIPVLRYDAFEDDEFESEYFVDQLDELIRNIFDNHDAVVVNGYVGRWDGPEHHVFILSDPNNLRRFILSEDIVEIDYCDSDETVSELQRYSHQWSFDVDEGSIVVRQWHHDGCNIFMITPKTESLDVVKGFKQEELGI